jgi:hypothetical protein
MVKQRWIEAVISGSVMLGCLIWTASMAMAGTFEGTEQQPAAEPRSVLVSGAGAVASGRLPAVIIIDVDHHDANEHAQLELSIAPITVAANEAYLIVVSEVNGQGAGKPGRELSSFSFFPPPRVGEIRRFYMDVPPISSELKDKGDTRLKLSIAMVSVDPKQDLVSSSVRIVDARIVDA